MWQALPGTLTVCHMGTCIARDACGDASADAVLGSCRMHCLPLQAAEEAPEAQSAAEETAWQEYRPEDFGTDVAAGQPGPQDEDELLRAAIQASKADALAQEARFMSANGGASHRVLADVVSNGPAVNGSSHRTWFPPAEAFVGKTGPSGPTCEGAGQQETNPGMQKEGSEDTYSDVMAFLLG